jgi:hypothetical protein
VIEPASTTCRNRPRSTRSNRIIAQAPPGTPFPLTGGRR